MWSWSVSWHFLSLFRQPERAWCYHYMKQHYEYLLWVNYRGSDDFLWWANASGIFSIVAFPLLRDKLWCFLPKCTKGLKNGIINNGRNLVWKTKSSECISDLRKWLFAFSQQSEQSPFFKKGVLYKFQHWNKLIYLVWQKAF